jgi:hypothetical protein
MLLSSILLSEAESVVVHLSQASASPEFTDAWYQIPPDAQPTDRIALYPADIGANISNVDPMRYFFVSTALSAANSRATAQ